MNDICKQLTKIRISTIIFGTILLAGIIVPSAYSHNNQPQDCSDYGGDKPPCKPETQSQQSKQPANQD